MTRAETLNDSVMATIPPLESGDHLSRHEFERRYDAMPDLKKAELIEGIVYLGSPVGLRAHGRPNAHAMAWIGNYHAQTSGTITAGHASVRLDPANEFQPDTLLMIDPARGGQASLSDDDFIEGAPELVFEVAASKASIDLNAKLRVYQRNNVREYLVWRVLDRAIDWFVLVEGAYQRLEPAADGILRSTVFPGLWLDRDALVGASLAKVLEVLQQGIADPGHADFVARLNRTTS